MLEFCIDNVWFEWNGTHTVNVYFDPADKRAGGEGYNTDVFSMNYGRDDYTETEIVAAAMEYMERVNA